MFALLCLQSEQPKPPEPLATSTPTTQTESPNKSSSGIKPLLDLKPATPQDQNREPPWKRRRDEREKPQDGKGLEYALLHV